MADYTLNASSADFMQNDGTALVNSEIAIDKGTALKGGNVTANGPLDSFTSIGATLYDGTTVGGVNNAVGAVNWTTSIATASVTSGTNSLMLTTEASHGQVAGGVVQLSDTGNITNGVYRIVGVVNANSYTVNGPYVSDVVSGVTTSYPSAKSATDSTLKPVGNLVAGEYATRVAGLSLYNGVSTLNPMSTPASDYTRRKVHSRTAVRSHGVAAAIRAGYWDIYSGTFTTAPTVANDFAAFGADSEVADSTSGIGVGGEFSYRYGITSASGEYGTAN